MTYYAKWYNVRPMKKRLVSLEKVSDETLVAALSVRSTEPIPAELAGVYHALLGLYESPGKVMAAAAEINARVSGRSLLQELRFRQQAYAARGRALESKPAETR